ncbi:MAG: hypothetical protein J5725_12555 [Bacteroidales bacterium]|nr:hypothetical protein [Bacteroidales bacterium]
MIISSTRDKERNDQRPYLKIRLMLKGALVLTYRNQSIPSVIYKSGGSMKCPTTNITYKDKDYFFDKE